MPYVPKFGRIAGALALAFGVSANSNAANVLEWTDSILGDVASLSRAFSIDSLLDHKVTLVDNGFLANFELLTLAVVREGNGTMNTLSAPGEFTFTPIGTGTYRAIVLGDPGSFTSNGTSVDFSTFGVTVAAVPEPETWAMMLVGMGLVGWQLRRKVKASAASRFV